jgi:hypothetical protein
MATTQNPAKTLHRFLKRQTGHGVWIAYGTADAEITGYVLRVTKHAVDVQLKDNGDIVSVPLYSITEAVEI